MKNETQPMRSVLFHYGLENPQLESIGTGLINHTWRVSVASKRYTLQRVNQMFPAEIHIDIDRVTAHLEKKGLTAPRLITTRDGKQCYQDSKGDIWRLYSYIEGVTCNNVSDPAIAYQAGCLLGQFHKALWDLDYEFKHGRTAVHDTKRHINNLILALEQKQQHLRYRDITSLASEIINIAAQLPVLADVDERKVHGDPKINNFLFDARTGKGICMLDFDTLSTMKLPLEVGDAMRSWCNPIGENNSDSFFSTENFRAGIDGYTSEVGSFLINTERDSILPATQIIYIELAARFCADALNENYFAWDPKHFSSHSEHSQVRALAQLNAFKSFKLQYHEASRILEETFSEKNIKCN